MGLIFVFIVMLFPFASFLIAQWPGNNDLVMSVGSIYRIPLMATLCTLPTLLYVGVEQTRVYRSIILGTIHCLLTISIVLGVFYFFGWFSSNGNTLSVFFVCVIGYIIGRICIIRVYQFYDKFAQLRLNAEYELRKKEAEQKALLYYTDELERQNITVQKFRHDYQNILLSIDSFIQEKDLDGLEAYYVAKIKTVSNAILKEEFSLQNLRNIKEREIKSILTGKLLQAQNSGIDVSFEADIEIEDFLVNSIDLVRIIGILMDNAIEECNEMSGGKLLVGCFKEDSGITVIVQNSCRQNIPKLHLLLQAGFSTKGEGRGLGLSNLQEFVNSHSNLTLETCIDKDNFIQKLRIRRL